jgi:hypothetical protein
MIKLITGLAIIALIAVVTNPGVNSHRAVVRKEVRQRIYQFVDQTIKPKKKWEEVALAIGKGVATIWIDQKVDAAVSIDDHVLFSITKIKIDRNAYEIGIGAFGNVWLITDVIEAMNFSEFAE